MNIDDDDDDNTDLLWSRQRIQDDVNVNDDNSGGQKEIFFSLFLCLWIAFRQFYAMLLLLMGMADNREIYKAAIHKSCDKTCYIYALCCYLFLCSGILRIFFFFLWTMLEQLWFDSIRFFSVWLINYISVHKRRSSMINVCVLTFCGAIWIANWQYLFLILGRCQQYEEIISSFISSLVKIN